MPEQTTSHARIIFVVIILVIIGVLMYILTTQEKKQSANTNIAVTSPINIPDNNADIAIDFDSFNDGLHNPGNAQENAPDEYGVGITSVRVYMHDLNRDGRMDRITRTHIENGTSHFTNTYKIEIATVDGFIDITPPDMQTIESADCALQKLRFSFTPLFSIEKIGREMGDDYTTPTMAYRSIYRLENNQMVEISKTSMREICDVSELF
ncbi:MAG: hypothetical protein NC311_00705 [Muribaculaceae bacterium]|nr:hypothetical protein [Muribaculaceae bacterium]